MSFNLTAHLQVQAPNLRPVITQMRQQLANAGNVQINPVSPQTAANVAQVGKQAQAAGKHLKNAAHAGRGFAGSLMESVKRAAGLSIALGTIIALQRAITDGFAAAFKFERELARLQQVTGKTKAQLGGLTEEVRRLAKTFGTSSEELLTVSRTLAQAGFSAETTKRLLDTLAKTDVAATFDSIEDSAEGMIALLNQFGRDIVGAAQKADFARSVFEKINVVSKSFAVESADLITVIRRAGSVFKEAGGSVDELLAAFTSVRSATRESAESIAVGFRTIFTRIQRVETIDQLRSLGIALQDAEGKFIGPLQAVEKLARALDTLDPRDARFSAIVEELGGFRQVSKVIPLIKNYAVTQEALNLQKKADASLTKDAAYATATYAQRMQQLKETFLDLINNMVGSKGFKDIADDVLTLAKSLASVIERMGKFLPMLAALGTVGGFKLLGGMIKGGRGYATGGKVHAFNSGGFVPGTGNTDSVNAVLTPGEYVLRKSAVKNLQANGVDLNSMNRYSGGGRVGYAVLGKKNKATSSSYSLGNQLPTESGARKNIASAAAKKKVSEAQANKAWQRAVPKTMKNFSITFAGPKGSPTMSEDFTEAVESSYLNAISAASKSVGEPFGLKGTDITKGNRARVLKGLNDATIGNLFEQTLTNLSGNRYDKNPNPRAAYDLPKGLGNAGKLFPELKAFTPVEAKATMQAAGKKNDRIKKWANYLGEKVSARKIEREIDRGAKKKSQQGTQVAAGRSKFTTHQAGTFKMPKITTSSRGGLISRFSRGGQNTDSVPAKVMPGEFIINKKSASAIGMANLEKMNQSGKPLHFAKGGAVPGAQIKRYSGGGGVAGNFGTLALLGLPIAMSSMTKALEKATEETKAFVNEFMAWIPIIGLAAYITNNLVASFTALDAAAKKRAAEEAGGGMIAGGAIGGAITGAVTGGFIAAAHEAARAAERFTKLNNAADAASKGVKAFTEALRTGSERAPNRERYINQVQRAAAARAKTTRQEYVDDRSFGDMAYQVGGAIVGAIGGGIQGAAMTSGTGVGAIGGATVGAGLGAYGGYTAASADIQEDRASYIDSIAGVDGLRSDLDSAEAVIANNIRLAAAAEAFGAALFDTTKALQKYDEVQENRTRQEKELGGTGFTNEQKLSQAQSDFDSLQQARQGNKAEVARAQQRLEQTRLEMYRQADLLDEDGNLAANASDKDLDEGAQAQLKEQQQLLDDLNSNYDALDKKLAEANMRTLEFTQGLVTEGVKAGKGFKEIFDSSDYEDALKRYAQQLRDRGFEESEVQASLQRVRKGHQEQYKESVKLRNESLKRIAIEKKFRATVDSSIRALTGIAQVNVIFKEMANAAKGLVGALSGTGSLISGGGFSKVLLDQFGKSIQTANVGQMLQNLLGRSFGEGGAYYMAGEFNKINTAMARLPQALERLKVAAKGITAEEFKGMKPQEIVDKILGESGLTSGSIGKVLFDRIRETISQAYVAGADSPDFSAVQNMIKELGENAKKFISEVVNLQQGYTQAHGAVVQAIYKAGDAVRNATAQVFSNIIKNRDRLDAARGTDRGLGNRVRERSQAFAGTYGTTNINSIVARGAAARRGLASNYAQGVGAGATFDFDTIRKLNTENAAYQAEIRKTKQALKDYSSVLDQNANDIVKSVEKEKAARASIQSAIKDFTFADNEGRKQIAQSYTALNQALSAGSIEAIPDSMRGAVGSLLDQFKDVQIAGGLTGDQISKGFQVQTLDRLIKSQGGAGVTHDQIKQIYESTTKEDQLIKGLENLAKEQQRVDMLNLEFERQNIDILKQTLTQLNTQFLGSLNAIFNNYFGDNAGVAGGGPQFNNAGGKIFSSIFQSRGSDTVPAMLTPGEFVMNTRAVKNIGLGTLQAMNNGTQYFNEGGAVQVADGKGSALSMARYIGNNPKLMRRFGYKGKDDLKTLKESNNVLDILRAADDPINGPIGTLYRSLNIMKKFSDAGLFKTLNGRAVQFDTTSPKSLYNNFLKEWGTVGGNYNAIGIIGSILPQALLAFDAVSGAVQDFMAGGPGGYNMRHGDEKYMKKLKAQYRNRGGMINRADTVPAMLSKGEFVMSKSAVNKHGGNFLNALNNGKVSGFYDGGNVGSVARSGTGGYNSGGGLDASGLAREFDNLGQKLQGVADALDGLTIKHTVTMDGSMTIGGFDSKTIAKAVKNEVEELVVNEVKQRMGKRGFRAG